MIALRISKYFFLLLYYRIDGNYVLVFDSDKIVCDRMKVKFFSIDECDSRSDVKDASFKHSDVNAKLLDIGEVKEGSIAFIHLLCDNVL